MYYLDPQDQARFGLAEPGDHQPHIGPGTMKRQTAHQRKEAETLAFIASLQRARVPDVLAQHLAHLSAKEWQGNYPSVEPKPKVLQESQIRYEGTLTLALLY